MSLDSSGFLLDPEGELGQILNKHLVSTAQLPECPALILLGEAGSGKSHELRKLAGQSTLMLDLGEYGDEHRLDLALDSLLRASTSSTKQTLFLDALDEALLGLPRAVSVLVGALRRRPLGSVRLVLTCRTGAWPQSLVAQLEGVFGEKSVCIYELLMLRTRDVRKAAEANDTSPDDFLRAVSDRAAEPLATNPVTLDLLLRLYGNDGLPANKAALYEQGLLKLCEQPEVRRDRGSTPGYRQSSLSPAELLSVSTRMAALTTLSGRPSVSTASISEHPTGSVGLEELEGGTEGAGPNQVSVSTDSMRAALGHTGLFTARGPRCFGFAHKSYAEFLTARFIAGANFSPPQLRAILFGRDEQPPRIVPQLSETSAWLADLDSSFRDQLLRGEPGILLRSDMRVQSCNVKQRLVEGLLNAVKEKRLADLDDAVLQGNAQFGDGLVVRRFLKHVDHPDLHKQIAPLIVDSAQPDEVREAAINLGRACPSSEIMSACADLAIDPGAPPRLRALASYAVIQDGDQPTSGRLRPLALGEAGPDPNDELKGCGLRATWPHHLSSSELLAALTPPKISNYYGSYQSFLSDIPWDEAISVADLPNALRWARQHADSDSHFGSLGLIASAFAYAGWNHMNEPGVLVPLAELVTDRIARYSLPMRVPKQQGDQSHHKNNSHAVTGLFRSDDSKRRTLLTACLSALPNAKETRRLVWGAPSLAQPEDFEWALNQACASDGPISERFAELADSLGCYQYTGPWRNPLHLEMCLAARKQSAAVGRLMSWPLSTTLGSAAEKVQRDQWEQESAQHQRLLELTTARRPTISRAEHVDEVIHRCVTEDVRWFGRLWTDLGYDDNGDSDIHLDLTRTRGWALSNSTVRSNILECARRYLLECPVRPDAAFPDEVIIDPRTAASAILVLWHERREALRGLDPGRWPLIAPALVRGLSDWGNQKPKVVRGIVLALLRRARVPVCRTILGIASKSKTQSFVPEPLLALGRRTPRPLRSRLLQQCQGQWRTTKIMAGLLPWLIATRTPGALEYARSLIPPTLPDSDDARSLAKIGAFSLLPVMTDEIWSGVWQSLDTEPLWGDELLKHIAPSWGDDHPANRLHSRISVVAIGRLVDHLYERFSPRTDKQLPAFSLTEDTYIRQWRGQLVDHLSAVGTDESVAALRLLRDRHPEEGWFHRIVLQAEKQRRRVSWTPLSPATILGMRADANRRVVRSGEELLDVLIESLRRWEFRMRASDLVRTLWDEIDKDTWRPKDEETLCDVLRDHLQSDLTDRGIVHGREVQLSRRTHSAGEAGMRVDIWVETFLRDREGANAQRLCAVIEVKGSWNTGAASSVQGQLAERYLTHSGSAHGLYVVGWFESQGWDSEDKRRRSGPWTSIDEASTALASLASAPAIESAGVKIAPLVLNCRLA